MKTCVLVLLPVGVRVVRVEDRPWVTSTERRPSEVTVVRVVLKRSRCVRVEPIERSDDEARVRVVAVYRCRKGEFTVCRVLWRYRDEPLDGTLLRTMPLDREGERRTVALLRMREGVALDRTTGTRDRDGADRRTVGVGLRDDDRTIGVDRDRVELLERDMRGAELRELIERELRDEDREDLETDREGRADRLNEREGALDRLADERDEPRREDRPLTELVKASIATETTIATTCRRFGWADIADLLAWVIPDCRLRRCAAKLITC